MSPRDLAHLGLVSERLDTAEEGAIEAAQDVAQAVRASRELAEGDCGGECCGIDTPDLAHELTEAKRHLRNAARLVRLHRVRVDGLHEDADLDNPAAGT